MSNKPYLWQQNKEEVCKTCPEIEKIRSAMSHDSCDKEWKNSTVESVREKDTCEKLKQNFDDQQEFFFTFLQESSRAAQVLT